MILTIDFESFYSKEYSLSKMSEVDYALDPRFQFICCAVKEDAGPSDIHIGIGAIRRRFERIKDWSRIALLAHNCRFDGSLLCWHLGFVPGLYLDTLGMARALTHANTGKSSLKAVSEYLGLPPKGDEIVMALGKRLEMFTPAELDDYCRYCLRDNDNCYSIFQRFMRVFPRSELPVIDAALRMFIQPQTILNPTVLAEHLGAVKAEKEACLARVAHIDKSVFSSNIKFADLLQQHGVDVPMKISPTTGGLTFALAKNDREFKELCVDATQPLAVQALLAARLGVKSTIEETRTQKMLHLSLREWPDSLGRGWFAAPLRYYGAHTGRFSGDDGINAQNFKRGSRIKEAIEAPPGYRILHRDSSQIEARMTAWLARCLKLLAAFSLGRDVYSEFASEFYRMIVTKRDTLRRFVGKTSILGLGYGMGAERFRHTLFIGNGGMSVTIDLQEAQRLVNFYRQSYREITALWSLAGQMLEVIAALNKPWTVKTPINAPGSAPVIPGIDFTAEGLWMPNGLCIQYPNLRRHEWLEDGERRSEIVYDSPYKVPKRLFGGKVIENVSQGLSRIVITDVIERVKKDTKVTPFMSTHDSLDYCVPACDAPWWNDRLDLEFRTRPFWAPDLPLASEGGFGTNLAIAEDGNHMEHNR